MAVVLAASSGCWPGYDVQSGSHGYHPVAPFIFYGALWSSSSSSSSSSTGV